MPFVTRITRNYGLAAICVASVCLMSSCAELDRPEPNPYLAETQPPPRQEFRWSNGGMPKSFDPARASAAPETDMVRAIYEGLTEVDPRTHEAIPAVAEKWSVSEDGRAWTFTLRENARWSNGKPVRANDFVRSWKRLLTLGEITAHRHLLANFALMAGSERENPEPEDFVAPEGVGQEDPVTTDQSLTRAETVPGGRPAGLDVSAPDDRTLVVKLKEPDRDFAKLVAHPIFRPVFGNGEPFSRRQLDSKIVTNGAFNVNSIEENGIALERSETYWNHQNVKLDRVSFIPMAKADEALEAYRTGKVDAVTNADFAPLAQKVFSSYGDIRRNAFAALNFYEVNYKKPPFNDRRVREALAISLERERLLPGELEATMRPALSFLPFATTKSKLVQDKERARDLMEQAGFDGGRGFPVVRLVVNRNDTQQRIARSVAKMWKDTLNIDTELVVKENSEIADIRRGMDYDILRRGVVLPVVDESVSMSAILGGHESESNLIESETTQPLTTSDPSGSNRHSGIANQNTNSNSVVRTDNVRSNESILSQDVALHELRAIPLYFPTSFALVKPYVEGFEITSLDAPLLSEVSINSTWQPKRQ